MKNHATYTLQFKMKNSSYTKYHKNEKLARIYINGDKTNYFVCSDGNVYSKNNCKKNQLKKLSANRLKNSSGNSYFVVHLSVKNKSYTILLHRLVALAFIPNPDNKPEVNHKDGDKSRNMAFNLEWCTESENLIHAYKTGLKTVKTGENSHKSKISEKTAIRICELLEDNILTLKEISDETSCSKSTIRNILNKKSWLEVSSRYDISRYNVRESTNGNKRMTESLAINICEDISSGEYTLREISSKYHIPYGRVNDIKQRNTWQRVSKDYDFSNYKKHKI